MVIKVFEVIGSAITNFITCLSTAVTGGVGLVWDGTTVTDFGTLCLIPVGVAIVYFGYRLIKGLLSRA